MPKYATQKARGLATALELSQTLYRAYMSHVVIPHWLPDEHVLAGKFARPCPTTPRHGFVESRRVDGLSDLWRLWQEARGQDENAEIIIMPEIAADWSGIATPASVTFGAGNDGATAGKGKVLVVPTTPGDWRAAVRSVGNYCDDFRFDFPNSSAPFVEFVHGLNPGFFSYESTAAGTYFVQLRAGPAIAAGTVHNVKPGCPVDLVWVPELSDRDDMLQWEKTCRYLRKHYVLGCQHVAVWIGETGMTSHLAVQAISHGMSVVAGPVAPVQGECLPAAAEHEDHSDLTRQTVAELISRLAKVPHDHLAGRANSRNLTVLAVAAVHSAHTLTQSQAGAILLAHGLVSLAYLAGAACIGECRHAPGQLRLDPSNLHCELAAEMCEESGFIPAEYDRDGYRIRDSKHRAPSRDFAYQQVLSRRLALGELVEHVRGAEKDFARAGWDRAYGGKHWHAAAGLTVELADKLLAGDLSGAIGAANLLVNAAHNNGKLLDKFLHERRGFDILAGFPSLGIANPAAMAILDSAGLVPWREFELQPETKMEEMTVAAE